MKTFLKVGLGFVAGLAIGAVATKKYMEYKQYVEDVEEEVIYEESDSDSDNMNDENNEVVTEEETVIEHNDDVIRSVDDDRYDELLQELKYKAEAQAREATEPQIREFIDENIDRSKPYNISPNDFEDEDAYESDEYTLYADGYVTDSYGMPVSDDDIDNLLGTEFESFFGIYDNNQIWVRNERLQMDFSVIRDLDNFVDVAPARIKRMVGLQ